MPRSVRQRSIYSFVSAAVQSAVTCLLGEPSARLLGLVTAVLVLSGMQAGVATADQKPPYINSAYAEKGIEPTHFSPADIKQLSPESMPFYVNSIQWSSWGQSRAVGTGMVVLHPAKYSPSPGSPVTVVLGGLRRCGGVPVYTTYSLELAAGADQPEQWPTGQTGSFPCSVGADGFARRTPRGGGCIVGFLHHPLPDPEGLRQSYPRFHPALPGGGVTAFCHLRWTHWGGRIAVGDGLRENLHGGYGPQGPERNWPVRLQLGRTVWCPRAAQADPFSGGGEETRTTVPALAYTVLKLTEYGKPRVPSQKTLHSYGHRGLKRKIYWQRLRSLSAKACQLYE